MLVINCRLVRVIFLIYFITQWNAAFAQKNILKQINTTINKPSVEVPLNYLSSDEMRGRDTGSKEAEIAAQYLASEFLKQGVKPVANAGSYFQQFNIERTDGLGEAQLRLSERILKFQDDFVLLGGTTGHWSGEFIFAGYGTSEDFQFDLKKHLEVIVLGIVLVTTAPVIIEVLRHKTKK